MGSLDLAKLKLKNGPGYVPLNARTVSLSASVLQAMGVERTTGWQRMGELEKAGLATVERHPGRLTVVILQDADKTDE
jgi:hypothetical protein